MNICVVGAGAIGGWVAARLASAGHRVEARTSRGPLDRLQISEGARRDSVEFVTLDGAPDLLVLAVKTPTLLRAVQSVAIGPNTIILPLLNGVPWWFVDGGLKSIDPDGAIAAALPLKQTIAAVVHASASRPEPGHVLVKHADKLILGEPDGGPSERVIELSALFAQAAMRCAATDNVRRAIWYKLWGNATVNPLSALTRAPADRLLANPVLRAFMADGMAELAEIGAAIGCRISESSEDRMAVTARLGSFKPSMLQDVEAAGQIELEALVGAPREIAAQHGIPTPALDRIYAMTRLLGEELSLL